MCNPTYISLKCGEHQGTKRKNHLLHFLPYEQVYVINDTSPLLTLEARALVDTRFFINYKTNDRRRALAIGSKMDERMRHLYDNKT